MVLFSRLFDKSVWFTCDATNKPGAILTFRILEKNRFHFFFKCFPISILYSIKLLHPPPPQLLKWRKCHIRTTDMAYQRKLEDSFGVKMAAGDEAFHYDNCNRSYSAICSSIVSWKWYKQAKRKEKRHRSTEKGCKRIQ